MQPDSISPAAAAMIPSFTLSDMVLPIESLGVWTAILLPKRHDSVNPYYRRNPPQFQNLDTYPALRDGGCVFFAARGVDFGCFSSRSAGIVESMPPCRRRPAINTNRQLTRCHRRLARIELSPFGYMLVPPGVSHAFCVCSRRNLAQEG